MTVTRLDPFLSSAKDRSSIIILETNHLLHRHLRMRDLDNLFALYRDPEMCRSFPDGTLTYDETCEELKWCLHRHPRHPELGLWATTDKQTGHFLGRCGLLRWQTDGSVEVEVAYLIDKAYRGRGMGTEAALGVLRDGLEPLHLSRLISLITLGNAASVRVAEKIGMTFEREGSDACSSFLLYAYPVAQRRPSVELKP